MGEDSELNFRHIALEAPSPGEDAEYKVGNTDPGLWRKTD